jgi:hypothetical protein
MRSPGPYRTWGRFALGKFNFKRKRGFPRTPPWCRPWLLSLFSIFPGLFQGFLAVMKDISGWRRGF